MPTSSLLVNIATIAGIWAIFAIGLNIKFGYTGLLDFGHVAFFLVGAYTTALLVMPPAETQQFQEYILGLNWPVRLVEFTGLELAGGVGWFTAIAIGTIVAGVFGLLVALPAIRLREDYLAIALLGISVIAKRTVQTETWLANGPDSLRGFDGPLRNLFPLPGDNLEAAVLFGGIVFVFWTIAIGLLARERFLDSSPIANPNPRTTIQHITFGILTLGFGYLAARVSRADRDRVRTVPVVAGGLAAGALALVFALVGLPSESMLLFVGTVSVFFWIYAGIVTVRHFDAVPLRDWLIALGLALALLIVFVPPRLVEAGPLGTGGLLPMIALLAAFLIGAAFLLRYWPKVGSDTSRLTLLGAAGVWVFLFRYFVLSVLRVLRRGNLSDAATVLLEDILFLVQYQGTTIADGLAFNYARFLFTVVVAILSVVYLLSETAVRSPFGRVLKAIREDEDVAMSLGKNTFSYKVQSMVLGSAIAGLAGGLVAIYFGTLTFRNFEPLITFFIFLIVVIGGTANNKGVILGAALYWGFVQGTNDIAAAVPTGEAAIFALRVALLGAIFIAILYYRPQGIWGEERMISEVEEG